MNPRIAVLATAFAFIGGCAQTGNGNVRPPSEPYEGYSDFDTTSSGASSSGRESAGTSQRTRAEVHAEAMEAVRHHKSTLMDELEWFNPFVKHER